VGGGQQVVRLTAVRQAEEGIAVVGPTPTALEDLARNEGREQHLLRADGDHLFTHHLLDVAQDHQSEREPRIHAGCHPPHVARAHQESVARHIGVGRVVAQRP